MTLPVKEKVGRLDRATVFKFAGLVAFVALMVVIMVVAWPYITDVFSEGGVERLVARVQNAGAAGVFMLLGMQFLQIVVAFIPGEVVQLAAGLMYVLSREMEAHRSEVERLSEVIRKNTEAVSALSTLVAYLRGGGPPTGASPA